MPFTEIDAKQGHQPYRIHWVMRMLEAATEMSTGSTDFRNSLWKIRPKRWVGLKTVNAIVKNPLGHQESTNCKDNVRKSLNLGSKCSRSLEDNRTGRGMSGNQSKICPDCCHLWIFEALALACCLPAAVLEFFVPHVLQKSVVAAGQPV